MIGELLIILASILDFLTTYITVSVFSCEVEINLIPRMLCYHNLLILLIPIESVFFLSLYVITKRYSKIASYTIIIISYYPVIHNFLVLQKVY